MRDIHPSWQRAVEAIDAVQRALGSNIRDRDTGRRLDPGQAVAREMFGPSWSTSDEYSEFDAATECGPEFFEAAQRLIDREPTWLVTQ